MTLGLSLAGLFALVFAQPHDGGTARAAWLVTLTCLVLIAMGNLRDGEREG